MSIPTIPVGTIVMWGGTSAPEGWLLCNGACYGQAQYKELYSSIGDTFGTTDGGQFYVPDLRGRFVRGTDDGAGRDPDVGNRTDMVNPSVIKSGPGSVQDFAFQNHNHFVMVASDYVGVTTNQVDTPVPTSAVQGYSGEPTLYPPTATVQVSTETRPLNAYLNFIIFAGR